MSKISELPSVTPSDSDTGVCIQSGVTSRFLVSALRSLFQTEASTAGKAAQRDAEAALLASGVKLDTAGSATLAAGVVRWNDADKCVEYGVSSTEAISIGQEMVVRARNASGTTLANGTPVYINGATGNRPTIAKADADASATAATLIGLVTDSAGIANNADGRVTVLGLVNDVDTSAYSEGATLYLSAGTAGTITATKPTTEGNYVVRVGFVTRVHASQGSILVAPHYMGSVTGEAVSSAVSASAARTAIGAAGVDVAYFGASPSASAATNASAINSALSAGGLVFISTPGTYQIGDSLVIKSRTTLILSAGVVLKRVGMTNVSLIKNEGANSTSNAMDEDITILGNGARIEVNASEGSSIDVYGMRAHLNFYNVRRLRVSGLRCTDLERVNFFIQLANHEDCEISHLYVTGTGAGNIKDGIHLNGGDRLWVHDCYLAVNDDPIAFNCWDYATLAPRVQPLRNVVVERMRYGVPSGGTADGYCPRFLPSAWAAWSNGGSYILADTVNNGGYQYRKTNSGTVTASVAPTHTTTGQTVTGADGIAWTCAGACTFTKAPIENITLRDITVSAGVSALFTENNDANGRSIYTGQSSAGLCKNITFSRIRFDLPTAETAPLALFGISCENVVAEDIVLESGKLPSAIFQLAAASGRLVLRRIYAPVWRNSASVGLVQLSSNGAFSELIAEDCNITGLNDGTNFQSTDGILVYGNQANGVGRVVVRGGRYDWLPSLVRTLANGTVNIDIQGAAFAKVRRLYVATAGTGTTTISVRGNRFEQAATLGLWGATASTQTITGVVSGNIFDAASTIVADTTGASRITFSDAPAVTASLAGAAAGDLVRTSSGWQEYNGSAWGAVRN